MEKLNITRAEAENEAKLCGVIIPLAQFVVKKSARGRPKKNTSAVDSSDDEEVKKPVEKKSAEKKPAEKKPAEKKPAEKKPAEKKPVESSEESDDEEIETEAEEFIHDGIKYWITAENKLYNPETMEEVGLWDKINKVIKEVVEEEDD